MPLKESQADSARPAGRAGRKGRTIADELYEDFRQRIISGAFLPGNRLSPGALASAHGVSSTVVREALMRLVSDGLVQSQSQQGFAVVSMTEEDLKDLTRMRILIDSEGLRQSIRNGGLAWQSRVLAAHHMLANTPARLPDGSGMPSDAHQQAHTAFHEALVSGSGSSRLQALSRTLYASSELYRRLSRQLNTGRQRDNATEHRQIMEAALAGDEDLAVAHLTAHFQHTIDILTKSGVVEK